MIKCPTCGTELRDGVLMCPICGTKLPVPPPTPPQNTKNNPAIYSKTRIISFIIILAFLIIGLWRMFTI
ncbi:MAG: zinc ribbon domain-containing protein [Megasphaera sp.]|nr:zinc ribbon domain-containing protein [Megasphaera sp.]